MSNDKQLTPIQEFRGTLDLMRSELQNALPPQIPVERFIRTVITAVQMDNSLLNADRKTLLSSCMKAAQDGLLLDGREAALVKYFMKKTGVTVIQYIPMVGGLLKKARNSGEIKEILAEAVYDKDMFAYELGESPKITHKPYWGEDRGNLVACYAIVKTKDGGVYRKVMSKSDVDKIRAKSKAKDSGPWVDFYEQMGVKTVIKAVLKICPQSSDLQGLIDYDNEQTGIEKEERNVTPPKPSSVPTDLMAAMGLKKGSEIEVPAEKTSDEESPFDDEEPTEEAEGEAKK